MLPSIVSYSVFQRSLESTDTSQSLLTPVDEREAEYFRENIPNVESPEELLSDFRLYTFALRAFNMDDQVNSRAIVQKSLEEGVTDQESFANQWADKRFLEMAQVFGFAELGTENVQSEAFADFVIDRYNVVTREVRAGEENPAVRLAAYFERNAGGINNWYDVIASSPLRDVVFTALNVPPAILNQGAENVANFLETRYDVEDFKDPDQVGELINRYLVNYDINSPSALPTNTRFSAALTLLTSGGSASTGSGSLFNLTV